MSSLKFKITESILSQLTKINEIDNGVTQEDKKFIDENIKNGYITTQTLKLIVKYGKSKGSVDLKTLLQGSSIYHKEIDINNNTKPSAEAVKRRAYLQLRQQQKEYNKMVHGTETSPESRSHNSNQENPYLLIKNQISVTANMIVSVFVMFGIGYFMGGSVSSDENTKMVCGLAASIGIMIVEMTLFILRAVRMEDAFENKKSSTSSSSSVFSSISKSAVGDDDYSIGTSSIGNRQ